MTKPTRLARTALMMTAAMVQPLLAKDAKPVDLMPIFKDVTTKTFDAKKLGTALDGALKDKLAADADLNDVAVIMHELAELQPGTGADAPIDEQQEKSMVEAASVAPDAPVNGNGIAGKGFDAEPIRAFCAEKGMGSDDIDALMKMLPQAGATDEDPEDDEEKKKMAKDLQAKDQALKSMVSKDDMKLAIDAAVAAERKHNSELQAAKDFVRPICGEIAGDSAEGVYRAAAKHVGVENADTIHASALPQLIKLAHRPAAFDAQMPNLAVDGAAAKNFADRFPGAARIGTV